jgi:hypothetical protein
MASGSIAALDSRPECAHPGASALHPTIHRLLADEVDLDRFAGSGPTHRRRRSDATEVIRTPANGEVAGRRPRDGDEHTLDRQILDAANEKKPTPRVVRRDTRLTDAERSQGSLKSSLTHIERALLVTPASS